MENIRKLRPKSLFVFHIWMWIFSFLLWSGGIAVLCQEDTGMPSEVFLPPGQYDTVFSDTTSSSTTDGDHEWNIDEGIQKDIFVQTDKYEHIPDWNSMGEGSGATSSDFSQYNSILGAFLPGEITDNFIDIKERSMVSWLEHFGKQGDYMEFINIAFIHGMLEGYGNDLHGLLFNAKERIRFPIAIHAVKGADAELDDVDGLFYYLHICRLYYAASQRRIWRNYEMKEELKREDLHKQNNPFVAEISRGIGEHMQRIEEELMIFSRLDKTMIEIVRSFREQIVAFPLDDRLTMTTSMNTYVAVVRDLKFFLTSFLEKFTAHAFAHCEHLLDHYIVSDEEIAMDESITPQSIWALLNNHMGSYRYEDIDEDMYRFLSKIYLDSYFTPYIEHLLICEDLAEQLHRTKTVVILNEISEYEVMGETRHVQMIVTEKLVNPIVSLGECVEYLQQYLFVQTDKLTDIAQHCRTVRRMYYFYDASDEEHDLQDITDPTAEANGNEMSDFEVENLWREKECIEDDAAEEAVSIKDMACIVFFPGILPENGVKENEVCFPFDDEMEFSNIAMVMNGVALAPEIFFAGQHYPTPYFVSASLEAQSGNRTHSLQIDAEHANSVDGTTTNSHTKVEDVLENIISLLAGRVLNLGLGTGELHNFLVSHFPYLVVDSVEVHEGIFNLAYNEFSLRHGICKIFEFDVRRKTTLDITEAYQSQHPHNKIEDLLFSSLHHLQVLPHEYYHYADIYRHDDMFEDEDEDEETEVSHAERKSATQLDETIYHATKAKHNMEEYRCRSNVILTDAWNFVEYLYIMIAEQENDIKEDVRSMNIAPDQISVDMFSNVEYYDYIFVDTLDEFWIEWPGVAYEDIAMSNVDRMAASFTMIKQILRPYTGMAIIRVVKDISYQFLYQKLVSVFRASQVLVVELSNTESLFVAARDRFTEFVGSKDEWICEKVQNEEGEEVEHCRPRTELDERLESEPEDTDGRDANVVNVEVLIKQHSRYRVIPHPCEDESMLVREMAFAGLDLGFSYRTSLGALHGLNCNPMTYTPRNLNYEALKKALEDEDEEYEDESTTTDAVVDHGHVDESGRLVTLRAQRMEALVAVVKETETPNPRDVLVKAKEEDEDTIDTGEDSEEDAYEYDGDAYVDLPDGLRFDL